MTPTDTSAEAVERLALSLQIADQPITAATLRALAAERDAARAEAKRLQNAGRPLHAAAVAAVGSLKPSDHKRAALAIACRDWRAALEGRDDV